MVALCLGVLWALLPLPLRAAPQISDGPVTARQKALRLESIEITGNKRTRSSIIEAYLRLQVGDPVDVDILDAARQRLISSDYFDSVEFSTRPGGERGSVVLVIEVDERGYPSFETGFGYDDLYGWFMTLLGLRFDNTFGPESKLQVGWRFGYRLSGIDATFYHPLKPAGRIGIGAAAWGYNQEQLFYSSFPTPPSAANPSEWREFRQQVERLGVNVSGSYRLTDHLSFTLGLRAEAVEPDSTFTDRDADIDYDFSNLPGVLQSGVSRTNLNGVFFNVIRDTRRNVSFPLSGSLGVLQLRANTSALGSDLSYVKGVIDLRKYIGLGGRTVWASRVHAGATESTAPYYDRFYVGGIYSIRGFRELSLSPTDGDEGFWLYSGELRFPLTLSGAGQPRLTGLIFWDVGQGWQWDESTTIDDVQSGVGYGVRLKLPWLGTLGLDAGIPLTAGRTGDPFRVHGSLGFSF